MAKIIMLHSFRRGVGRTLLTANLSAAIAAQGLRVGLIDMDLELPELHLAFALDSQRKNPPLNDVLWKEFPVEQAAVDVSNLLPSNTGGLYLLPASDQPDAVNAAQRSPLKMETVSHILDRFTEIFSLDYILIDSSAGLDENTMSLLALADVLLVLLRPDQQEYQGTALLVEIGARLNIPRVLVVTNEVGENLDRGSIKEEVKRVFHTECAAIMPHNALVPLTGKGSLLVSSHPENPVAAEISRLAVRLTQEE